ncbi:MAG: hypothetical protein ACOC4Y_00870 [bacterium]
MINDNKDELKKSCEKMDLEYMVYFTAWNFRDAMEATNELVTGYAEE